MTDSAQRIAPYSVEAEESLIGLMMGYPQTFPDYISTVKPKDFFLMRNEKIWAVMAAVHQQGQEVNQLAVTSYLNQMGKLEDVGGQFYLARLAATPESIRSAPTFAKIIVT